MVIQLLLILGNVQVIQSRVYDGNIWDFEGQTAAEQIIYGTTSEGMFGSSISAWGDRVAIGEISGNDNKGQVHIYTHLDEEGEDVGGWYLESTLTDYYGADGDLFGYAVALYATTVVVGAKHNDWNGYEDSGSAFIYEIHLNRDYRYEWTYVTELTREDAEPQDYFGNAVAIYGNTTVIGCYGCDPLGTMSGAVYVYAKYYLRDSDDGMMIYEWAYHHTMTAPSGSRYDWFGISLAIYNDVIAVGATGLDDPISMEGNTGGAYVFDVVADDNYADGIGWKVFAELTPGDGHTGDKFGSSIAIFNGVVVIGAPDSSHSSSRSGAVYVYHKQTNSDHWYFEQKLLPIHPTPQLHFGTAVGVYNDILLVGSMNETGLNPVCLYGREYDTGDQSKVHWDWIHEIEPVHEIIGDRFGGSVSVFESLIVIGASMASSPWQEDQGGNQQNERLYTNGATHIFWATDRIAIEYISKKIKAGKSSGSPPHLTSRGLFLSGLCGLLVAGYIYYAAASYLVKREDEEEQTKLLSRSSGGSREYQQAAADSTHGGGGGDQEDHKIDISMRDLSSDKTKPEPNHELLRASLARLSTRSSHGGIGMAPSPFSPPADSYA
jgi:hypothetical protein